MWPLRVVSSTQHSSLRSIQVVVSVSMAPSFSLLHSVAWCGRTAVCVPTGPLRTRIAYRCEAARNAHVQDLCGRGFPCSGKTPSVIARLCNKCIFGFL